MPYLANPFIIPLGVFVMVIAIVGIVNYVKMQEKELAAHHQLRQAEMEHELKMKQLEIEKARIELEKMKLAKMSPSGEAGSSQQGA